MAGNEGNKPDIEEQHCMTSLIQMWTMGTETENRLEEPGPGERGNYCLLSRERPCGVKKALGGESDNGHAM